MNLHLTVPVYLGRLGGFLQNCRDISLILSVKKSSNLHLSIKTVWQLLLGERSPVTISKRKYF